jgi:hypothetical protein
MQRSLLASGSRSFASLQKYIRVDSIADRRFVVLILKDMEFPAAFSSLSGRVFGSIFFSTWFNLSRGSGDALSPSTLLLLY